jgi:hypothetical protein
MGSARGWTLAGGLLALAACGFLAWTACTSRWVMDADEAVHAVEGLRRYDALRHGELASFLERCYLPDRWQPPVQDHVRWYGIVHSLSLVGSFALLGPGEAAARLPSVLWLALAIALFAWLAHRLAPQGPRLAAFAAVFLLLSSPNLLTFAPQCLIETSSLATCALAFAAHVRFLERPLVSSRALVAGAALGLALLAKYDHGLILAASLGVSELVRHRMRPAALARSRAWVPFAVAGVIFAAWLAHPEKLQAFRDALAHPAFGTPRTMLLNPLASWLLELTSSPLVAIGAVVVLLSPRRAWGDERLRALWIYAALSMLLLVVRARFQFRYHYVEAPFALLYLAVLVPQLASDLGRALREGRPRAGAWLLSASAAGFGLLAWVQLGGASFAGLFGRLFQLVYDAFPGHLGLSLEPRHYADSLVSGFRAALALSGWGWIGALAALGGLGFLLHRPAHGIPPGRVPRALAALAVLACVPGAVQLAATLPERIDWEYEGTPELRPLIDHVASRCPSSGEVLLGGGWDQLSNNTLRFELLTRGPGRNGRFEDLDVVGDMIGSIVLPPGPRILHWARVLDGGVPGEQPEAVVLIRAQADFRYRVTLLDANDLYKERMRERGWISSPEQAFDGLGCTVQVFHRGQGAGDSAGAGPPWTPAASDGGRVIGIAGERGWLVKDDAWRHLRNPLLLPAAAADVP